jgi:type IV pilus assembly protein PilC
MPLYSYKIKDKNDKVVEDVMQAVNKKEVASSLKSEGYQVLTVRNIDKGMGAISFGRVSVAEKASFCRFLATMLRAGLALPEAIDILKEETKNPKLKKIIYDMSFQIRKGKNLSSVLSKYKKEFDPVFVTMVKAGEESGTLDKSFDYLAKQLLATYELIQKVRGALMYPAVIVAAMIANFIIMVIFVLPKLSEVFTQLNVDLPFTTRLVLGFGNYVGDNVLLVSSIITLAILLAVAVLIIPNTRQYIFGLVVRIPAVRKVVTLLDITRFSQTLSTLLKSGVPIMVSLEVSSDLIVHPALKKHAEKFSKGVEEGKSLSEVISRQGKKVFPITVTQTIKAGEKSGSLEVVLEEMGDFYAKEVDYNMKRLTSLVEPILMLVIGLAVGGMVVIMITPIYKIVGGIEGL